MAGSDFFRRTQDETAQAGCQAGNAAPPTELVQIAVVYAGKRITLYRNGTPTRRTKWTRPEQFDDYALMLGLRYLGSMGAIGFFAGEIEEARLYDVALTESDIRALRVNQPSVRSDRLVDVRRWHGRRCGRPFSRRGRWSELRALRRPTATQRYRRVSGDRAGRLGSARNVLPAAESGDRPHVGHVAVFIATGPTTCTTWPTAATPGTTSRWPHLATASTGSSTESCCASGRMPCGWGRVRRGGRRCRRGCQVLPELLRMARRTSRRSSLPSRRTWCIGSGWTIVTSSSPTRSGTTSNEGNNSRWDCIYTIPRDAGGLYGYWTATPKAETRRSIWVRRDDGRRHVAGTAAARSCTVWTWGKRERWNGLASATT